MERIRSVLRCWCWLWAQIDNGFGLFGDKRMFEWLLACNEAEVLGAVDRLEQNSTWQKSCRGIVQRRRAYALCLLVALVVLGPQSLALRSFMPLVVGLVSPFLVVEVFRFCSKLLRVGKHVGALELLLLAIELSWLAFASGFAATMFTVMPAAEAMSFFLTAGTGHPELWLSLVCTTFLLIPFQVLILAGKDLMDKGSLTQELRSIMPQEAPQPSGDERLFRESVAEWVGQQERPSFVQQAIWQIKSSVRSYAVAVSFWAVVTLGLFWAMSASDASHVLPSYVLFLITCVSFMLIPIVVYVSETMARLAVPIHNTGKAAWVFAYTLATVGAVVALVDGAIIGVASLIGLQQLFTQVLFWGGLITIAMSLIQIILVIGQYRLVEPSRQQTSRSLVTFLWKKRGHEQRWGRIHAFVCLLSLAIFGPLSLLCLSPVPVLAALMWVCLASVCIKRLALMTMPYRSWAQLGFVYVMAGLCSIALFGLLVLLAHPIYPMTHGSVLLCMATFAFTVCPLEIYISFQDKHFLRMYS